jgi:hypothetical protein
MSRALLLFVIESAIIFLALFNGTFYFTDASQEISDVTQIMIKILLKIKADFQRLWSSKQQQKKKKQQLAIVHHY